MKVTKRQASTKTEADLARAITRKHAVTITYLDDNGEQTLRTIEPYDLRTTASGKIRVHAMCRLRGEGRAFDIRRIVSYTCHRIAFVLERPAPTTVMPPAPTRSVAALIAFEINRDIIAAAYRTRTTLAA
ncbi:WYL domain-containing protein [Streptomyces sp. NPDC060366]|uniref:WYL domain-containing protein n=1 Tax=Streptomyces sp. NPDC060366 TaxID=3347105 RepID=UPI00365CCDB1